MRRNLSKTHFTKFILGSFFFEIFKLKWISRKINSLEFTVVSCKFKGSLISICSDLIGDPDLGYNFTNIHLPFFLSHFQLFMSKQFKNNEISIQTNINYVCKTWKSCKIVDVDASFSIPWYPFERMQSSCVIYWH